MSLEFDFFAQPNTISSISSDVDNKEKDPMTIQVKPKLNNFEADFLIYDEDYTLGEIIRERLLEDDRVQFAGCRKDHQLDNHIRIKIKLYKNRVKEAPDKAIIECLKLAARKSYQTALELRNSIPDIDPRVLETSENTYEPQQQLPVFQFDFKPDDFEF